MLITEHDRPGYVLMTYAAFQELNKFRANEVEHTSLADGLAMSVLVDVEFEPLNVSFRPADL